MDNARQRNAQNPLNRQIKDFILERIRDGKWKTGDRVPSEMQLAREFDASRMTVNRAIRELTIEGRLERVQGLGTFVASDAPMAPLFEIRPISHDIALRGATHTCRVIEVAQRGASEEMAARLVVPVGSPVFLLVALHMANGKPLQLERRLVNPALAPEFIRQDFTRVTGSDYLLAHVPYTEVEHQVDAVRPAAETAQLLGLAEGEPCLRLVRITFTGRQRITHAELIHPGDAFRLGGRFGATNALAQVA